MLRLFGFILITTLLVSNKLQAQYGFGTNAPNSNSVVHFTSSDSTKGVLLPVTTTAKLPVASNALKGMVFYNLDENCFQVCSGSSWNCLTLSDSLEWVDGSVVGLTAGNIYARQALVNGDTVSITQDGKIAIGKTFLLPFDFFRISLDKDATIDSVLVYNENGRLGIGTQFPASNFHVEGSGGGDNTDNAQATVRGTGAKLNVVGRGATNDAVVQFFRLSQRLWSVGIVATANPADSMLTFRSTEGNQLTIQPNGNVGIGKLAANPLGKLYVVGDKGGSADSTFLVTEAGDVGIKTIAPTKSLDVNGEARIRSINDTNNVAGVLAANAQGVIQNIPYDTLLAKIKDSSEWVDGSLVGLTAGNIYARQALANGDTVLIKSNGFIGIGKDNPQFYLDVDSSINTYGHYHQDSLVILTSRPNNAAVANNLAVGFGSLDSNTTGSANVAVGNSVLNSNQTGYSNTAIGHQAMMSNTTGFRNVALGALSFRDASIGRDNTAIGYASLQSTSGNGNTALGNLALNRNTSGGGNVGVGSRALFGNTEGNQNIGIGGQSLFQNIKGEENVGIGYRVLQDLDSSDYNTAIGAYSLFVLEEGTGNATLGRNSIRNIDTGDYNVAIGYAAGDNLISGDKNIIIGSNIDFPSTSADNQLNIGNIIYGTNIDGIGGTLSSGNIGIGTKTPSTKLHIADNTVKLTIQDDDATVGVNGHNNSISFTDQNDDQTGKIGFGTSTQVMFIQNENDNGSIWFSSDTISGTAADIDMAIASDGNVGIGTTNPLAKLQVDNTIDGDTSGITAQLNTYTTGATLTQNRSHTPLSVNYTATDVIGTQTNGQRHTVLGINSRVTASGTTVEYSYSSLYGRTIHNSSGDITDMFGSYSLAETQNAATSSGNIDNLRGIYGGATINPNSTGIVNSAVGVRANALNNNSNNTLGSLIGTSSQANNDNGGTVTNAYGTNNLVFNNGASTISNAYGSYSRIIQDDAGGTINNSYGYYSYIDHDAGTSNTAYLFRGDYDGTHTTKWGIHLTNETKSYLSGQLGIGELNPTEKLHVVGNVRATGSFISGTTTYPDYVFEDYFEGESKLNESYSFQSLNEIEDFIIKNKHLPGVKSIKEVTNKDGKLEVNMTETSIKNLEKIEELYLHLIEVNKSNKSLEEQNAQQQELINLLLKQNKELNKRVEALEQK